MYRDAPLMKSYRFVHAQPVAVCCLLSASPADSGELGERQAAELLDDGAQPCARLLGSGAEA